MDILSEFTVIAYVLLSAINVWAVFNQKWMLFSVTKPILMLVLLTVYLLNSSSVLISVIIALFFAWLGDLFLLSRQQGVEKDAKKLFSSIKNTISIGGFAFVICHIFYILTFYHIGAFNFQWKLYVIIIIYVTIGMLFYAGYTRGFAGLNKFMKVGIGVYVFAILMMSFSSTLIVNPDNPNTLIPFIGSILFILSDSLLAISYKTKNTLIYHPWVMASYLTAQFLIIMGLLFLGF